MNKDGALGMMNSSLLLFQAACFHVGQREVFLERLSASPEGVRRALKKSFQQSETTDTEQQEQKEPRADPR